MPYKNIDTQREYQRQSMKIYYDNKIKPERAIKSIIRSWDKLTKIQQINLLIKLELMV